MGSNKPKINIPMCVAFILFVLTLVSIHMTSGLYARYTVTSSSLDSARVAMFNVESSVQPLLDDQGKHMEGKYTLTVNNLSEVAVRYSLTVTMPDYLSMAVDEEEPKSPETGKNQAVFENSDWVLEPGENTGTHTLTFAVVNWSGLTSQMPNNETENLSVDFNVTVTAEQID